MGVGTALSLLEKDMASLKDGCGHDSPKPGLGVPAKSQEEAEEAFGGQVASERRFERQVGT